MRKLYLLAVATLLFIYARPQKLNWAQSFTPAWGNGNVNGNAINLGGSIISGNVNIGISGGAFGLANGNSGAQTPTVSGAVYSAPGTSNIIEMAPNFSDNLQNATLTIFFNIAVKYVNFLIVDIDKKNPNNNKYLDRVQVTGANGAQTFIPALTKYDATTDPEFLQIAGNTAFVNPEDGKGDDAATNATDQRGTIHVNFGGVLIQSITITYDNSPGAHNNPGSQSIGVSDINFAQNVLPVKLSSFSGYRTHGSAVLQWASEHESNTDSYEIQRNQGNGWETIGQLPARGNSSGTVNYTYTDPNPPVSLLFYRLKQNDHDLHFDYSGIIRLSPGVADLKLLAYPNPFISYIGISVYSAVNQDVVTILYDVSGKPLRSEQHALSAGSNNFSIMKLDQLAKGIYYLEIRNESHQLIGYTKLLR